MEGGRSWEWREVILQAFSLSPEVFVGVLLIYLTRHFNSSSFGWASTSSWGSILPSIVGKETGILMVASCSFETSFFLYEYLLFLELGLHQFL